ncbi:MAG: hypothetical protein VKJ02_08755 [Snowella sp.]|nr:hypothetical protein [Snowella sp.]
MEKLLPAEADIKDILNKIDQKLDGLLDDINDIRVSGITLNTKIDQLEKDIREIKDFHRTQIWRLIWILVWTLVGIVSTMLLGAITAFILIALPNKIA